MTMLVFLVESDDNNGQIGTNPSQNKIWFGKSIDN